MQVRGYLNTSSRAFTRSLDTTPITWPQPLTAGEDIIVKFQLSQERGGFVEPLDLPVISVKARIGTVKQPGESGAYQLGITYGGNSVETAAIAWDATAEDVATAIDTALGETITALKPCAVVPETGGAYRIRFKDGLSPTIAVTDNELWPLAFVNVEEQAHDEGSIFILSHQQTPVAETTTLGTRAPDLPVVTTQQHGSEEDGTIINAIQKLVIPPSFSGGTFQLSRGGLKSDLLPLPLSINALADAIERTKDEGGEYRLSASSSAFFIEFAGEMGGQVQEEFEVVPFDVPTSDHYIKLSTDTAAMTARMRRAGTTGEVTLPLHITVYVENEIAVEEADRYDFSFPLVFTSPPGDDEHNASTDMVWDQPPARLDVLPHSTDAVMVGHRSYRYVFGNGSDESFLIPHNLGANPHTVVANAGTNLFTCEDHNFQNLDPVTFDSTDEVPAPLVEGTTYWVRDRTDDTFAVSLLQGGPAIDLTDAGSGTITVRTDDGPGDGYHVTVYERLGNRAKLPDNAYTVELTSDDALTLSGFPSTPTAKQYVAHITKVGRAATYQALELPQARVIDLTDDLDAIRARVAALELLSPSQFRSQALETGQAVRKPLPYFGFLYPQIGRAAAVPPPAGARLGTLDAATLPRVAPTLIGAVHDAAAEALPTTLDGGIRVPVDPSPEQVGRVFENETSDPVELAVGTGWDLPPGEWAITDGEEWYPAARYADGESSYYPAHLERLLWEDMIQPDELPEGGRMEVRFPVELAMLMANTPMHCQLVIETAHLTADTAPGTPGSNLASRVWAAPHLEQDLRITSVPREYVFGYRVKRAKTGELTADRLAFGKWVSTTAPAAAAFSIRARLIRWDTPNAITAPVGMIAVVGGVPFADNFSPDQNDAVGFLVVE